MSTTNIYYFTSKFKFTCKQCCYNRTNSEKKTLTFYFFYNITFAILFFLISYVNLILTSWALWIYLSRKYHHMSLKVNNCNTKSRVGQCKVFYLYTIHVPSIDMTQRERKWLPWKLYHVNHVNPRPPELFSVTRPPKGGCCNPLRILYNKLRNDVTMAST